MAREMIFMESEWFEGMMNGAVWLDEKVARWTFPVV
jgi:hypothetical protein